MCELLGADLKRGEMPTNGRRSGSTCGQARVGLIVLCVYVEVIVEIS